MDIQSISSSAGAMQSYQAAQTLDEETLEQEILQDQINTDADNQSAQNQQMNGQMSQQQITDPSSSGVQGSSAADNNFFVQFAQNDSQH